MWSDEFRDLLKHLFRLRRDVRSIVDVPSHWQLVAYLCIGYPKKDSVDSPELEQLGWETRVDLESIGLKR
jgi:5,6-dimethylbenzimidazole synthase